ncbi:MAG: type VI secretion system baseplate subunit TssG [Alphaproteobacteria bacterium]
MEKMALPDRDTTLSLEEQLHQKPYEFEFAQAIRLLQILNPIKISLGQGYRPEKEAVRLKARVFLSAPPSDLFQIKPSNLLPLDSNSSGESLAVRDTHTEVHVNFLGIAGIQGPLPLPYTELLLERLRQKDTVFRDFLDIFNHRLLSLFYRIQQKFSPALNASLPHETPQGKNLQALVGWTDGLSPFFLRHMLFYSSLFWQKTRNPSGLRAILQHLFQIPVQILPCQGAWIPLEKEDCTYLGNSLQGIGLGKGAVLGKRVWCQSHGIVIRFAFEELELFQKFLPCGEYFFRVQSLISYYAGPGVSFKISLGLKHKPVSWIRKGDPMFLGWTSWLGYKKRGPSHDLLSHQVILSV